MSIALPDALPVRTIKGCFVVLLLQKALNHNQEHRKLQAVSSRDEATSVLLRRWLPV